MLKSSSPTRDKRYVSIRFKGQKMIGYGSRYFATVGTTLFVFMNFVACGTQLYQVSLEQDIEPDLANSQVESAQYGIHSLDGWAELPIPFQTSEQLGKAQLRGLLNAMRTWETATGKTLFSYDGKDNKSGDSFNDLYSSLDDQVNGHYLDNVWDKTGKSSLVLATTIWNNDYRNPQSIETGDIRFNSEYYVIGDSLELSYSDISDHREIVDMESLALHELGHLLGLGHIASDVDPLSIMNPSLFIGEGLTSRHLSEGDVQRIQDIYGCDGDACDIDWVMSALDKIQANSDNQVQLAQP
ncbi:MAG: matrixin family metalloprotease [Oligoflexales bacterium]